jgi:hypothetical protein
MYRAWTSPSQANAPDFIIWLRLGKAQVKARAHYILPKMASDLRGLFPLRNILTSLWRPGVPPRGAEGAGIDTLLLNRTAREKRSRASSVEL